MRLGEPGGGGGEEGLRCSRGVISYREGLGTSLKIMGLATIDVHSQKEHIKIHKIPKFGVNQAS